MASEQAAPGPVTPRDLGFRVIQVTDRSLKTERSKVATTIDTLLTPTDAD